MEKHAFTAEGRNVALYKRKQADLPLIVLHHFSEEGDSIAAAMQGSNAPACNLLGISKLSWDHDMTPWYCPPLFAGDTPCTGGAEEYLKLLLTVILPQARAMLNGKAPFTGIAGYSLAGLFALYALYRCDAFDRAASMSGSLWFPDFKEYVKEHALQKRPDRLYLSLGEKYEPIG